MLAEGRGDWLSELLRVGQSYRQLSDAQITKLVEPLEEKVKQMAEVMSLELPEEIDYRGIFSEAHRRLTTAADEAAMELAIARRTGIVAADEEASLLAETQSLTEAVRQFTKLSQSANAVIPASQHRATAVSGAPTPSASSAGALALPSYPARPAKRELTKCRASWIEFNGNARETVGRRLDRFTESGTTRRRCAHSTTNVGGCRLPTGAASVEFGSN